MRAPTSASLTALAIVAVLVASFTTAHAADGPSKPSPEFRAAVKRFLVAQNVPAQMSEQMTYSAAEQALRALASSGVTITEPMQAIVVEEARKDFASRFGDVEYLADLYSKIYVDHFSEKEMGELASFYESPIAKKMLDKSPALAEAFTVHFQEATAPLSAELSTRVDKRLREAGLLEGKP